MAIIQATSILNQINPTDANGSHNPTGWDSGGYTQVVVYIEIPQDDWHGGCGTGGEKFPRNKELATVEDITGDGFYGGTTPGPDNAIGNIHTVEYRDDGQYWSTNGSTYGSGIPDVSKERTYELVFTDGSVETITVFVIGRNLMYHQGFSITDPQLLNQYPSWLGTPSPQHSNWSGNTKGAETIWMWRNGQEYHSKKQFAPQPGGSCPAGTTPSTNFTPNPPHVTKHTASNGNAFHFGGLTGGGIVRGFALHGNATNPVHCAIGYTGGYQGQHTKLGVAKEVFQDDDDRWGGYTSLPFADTEDYDMNHLSSPSPQTGALYGWFKNALDNNDISNPYNPSGPLHALGNWVMTGSQLDTSILDNQGTPIAHKGVEFMIPDFPLSSANSAQSLNTEVREIYTHFESTLVQYGVSGEVKNYSDIVQYYESHNPSINKAAWFPVTGVAYKWMPNGDEPCTVNPVTISTSNITVTNETTVGANDGSATLNTSSAGGTPPYIYTWTNSNGTVVGNSNTITGLSPGNYSISLEDSNGCTDSAAINIRAGSNPCNISANPLVINYCGGTSDLVLSGPSGSNLNSANWTIVWTDPTGATIPTQTTNQLIVNVNSSLNPGTYTAHITDNSFVGGNCTQTYQFLNVASTEMSLAASSTDCTTFGGNDGTATALVSGGQAPYTYSWSDGQTTPTATNLIAGVYSVTVTDERKCTTTASVVVGQPVVKPLNATCLDVCLDLNSGVFDFVDNNNYSPSGQSLPYRIALTIEHSNGTIVHPGTLSSPDVFSDTDLSNLRTYNYNIKYGQNNSIPIPTSGGNYISDIYKVTTEWNFSGGTVADVTETCYINAQGLAMFDLLSIDSSLTYSCTGDILSKDNTLYGLTGIPYSLTRTHKLFAPVASGLPNPAYSTGSDLITHSLYEGQWANFIETEIVWTVPQMPALGYTYEPVCVRKTLYGATEINVECYIDPCVIQHYSKKIKNKYDNAVCDCDTLKIKKYRAQLQRIVELLNVYIIGEKSDCVNDFSELWTILGITYQDHLTDPNCCSTPNINPNLIGDGGCNSDDCDGAGGGSGGPDPDPEPCPCDDAEYWSEEKQSGGQYIVGDYVQYGGSRCNGCFQLGNIPSEGFDSEVPSNEKPGGDDGAYWVFIDCSWSSNNPTCYGCTDSYASNYNANAYYDDGSCIYPPVEIEGCMDDGNMPSTYVNSLGGTGSAFPGIHAFNIDLLATIDDGSCIYCQEGCPDPNALNPTTPISAHHIICDDGSCCYISGCTDPTSPDYDPNACQDDGSCTYPPTGCTATNWHSIYDINNNVASGHGKFSGLYLDSNNNIWSLVRKKSQRDFDTFYNNPKMNVLLIGNNSNVASPDDWWTNPLYHPLAYLNANHQSPVSSQEMVFDSNDNAWIINGDEMQKWDEFPGMSSANSQNDWPSHANARNTILHSDMTSANSGAGWGWAIPSHLDHKTMRYVTMDIDGSDVIHILFGSQDEADKVGTGSDINAFKTYYYTFNTSTKAWTLIDTLNISVSDCHLYWKHDNFEAYSGEERAGEWNAILRVDGSNKPWVASNGKLMKYDSGWKNIAGATATANGGDFYTIPGSGANTVFSVDKSGTIANPGGARDIGVGSFEYREVVLDFLISGSYKYILTYSTRLLEDQGSDWNSPTRRGIRQSELILHIHNGSSWSRFPVPTRLSNAGNTIESSHPLDEYMDWPYFTGKPSIAVKGTTPYVHCAVNQSYRPSTGSGYDYGEARATWVQSLNTSSGVWTAVGSNNGIVNTCSQAFGIMSSVGQGSYSSNRQPMTSIKYVSATDDLIIHHSENLPDVGDGPYVDEPMGIKRICL